VEEEVIEDTVAHITIIITIIIATAAAGTAQQRPQHRRPICLPLPPLSIPPMEAANMFPVRQREDGMEGIIIMEAHREEVPPSPPSPPILYGLDLA
jgi:hypothetical protein